jgi:antirestriction protein ArdC
LDRIKGSIFGSPDYAFEELVAELGAAYLCADLAITSEPREDHASYIASWLKALRDDPRNLFRAASYAEKAAGYLHGLQEGASLAAAA